MREWQLSGLIAPSLTLSVNLSGMGNAESACLTLGDLRGLGMGISIDDFGTGYSSLSYLHRFPVNTLKVDRSFISRMGALDENSEIVRTIITLASNLGMEVVAEGVETERQDSQLKALGCEYAQGFLYSAPLDAQETAAWLSRDYGEILTGYLPNDELAFFGIAE
jgi:EAL domain-containing protein (putative c-di-GMP-specific phosphodiesterase class I)